MSPATLTSFSNVDGNVTPTAEARVPVLDRGFLYGDSVYEVFRTYTGVPLFYDEHWQRMLNSARLIHMHITQSHEVILREIGRTVKATGAGELERDVYVRYMITRGEGPVDLYPNPDLQTRYVIIVKEVPTWDPKFYSVGMKAAIPAVRRNPTDSLDPNIKGGNYLNNVIAITEAKALGADESVILNRDGFVTEASNSNVFFVIDGEVVTPAPSAGNLLGITKKALHEACAGHGIEIIEREVHAGELAGASECFVTSATREVMPIASLRLEDGRWIEFPPGGGEKTKAIAKHYRAFVDAHVREHANLSMW
ncbi:MAG: aminotransferase class IV [Gammaproteobacteria bacterium]|nr:aminotransferase class IV [Gammaproteobacteria bacterium]